jgi:phage shock protein PspC (stress-responsive transcriptional regulator)|tara:strand:- start:99 stop:215 length:117 start_codon:yes stop_codon:yes gene_type:complete
MTIVDGIYMLLTGICALTIAAIIAYFIIKKVMEKDEME